MYNNAVTNQFSRVLVDYEVNGVMHHELRTVNHVTGLDSRMSDYKFSDAQYPMTFVPVSTLKSYNLEIRRGNNDTWDCVFRKSHKLVASFADFNDALEYVKTHN